MIVTFYTPRYAKSAKQLVRSCATRGYDVEAVAAEETGSWAGNCALKAGVVRDALTRHEQVLWLDADATVHGDISELLRPHDGMRMHIVTPDQFKAGWFAQRYRYHAVRYGSMWNSGILSVRRSPEVMGMMDAWVDQCQRSPGEWDQMCLQWAHIATGQRVPVADIPREYRAGGKIIAHKSAFHRLWKRSIDHPTRKVLLLGSGPDLPQWWAGNGRRYLDQGYAVVAMNNAIGVTGEAAHLWLVPNDYTGRHHAPPPVPSNWKGYPRATNPAGNWIHRPLWSKEPTTVMLSSLAHLLNEAQMDQCRLIVHLAGCDMNYDGEQSHFYGTGTCDPLRYRDDELATAMRKIETAYRKHGSTIHNASGQEFTRLVFPRC